jgi:hypothetical protein
MRTHHRLAAVADCRHGVVARRQLRELGYSEAAIGRAVAFGRLHRVHRGVYAVGHAKLSPHGRCHAALLTCGPRSLLSHSSAAWLWGLQPRLVAAIEVAVPHRGHGRRTVRVINIPSLREEDRTTSDGLPVTAVPRTLLDRASTISRRGLEKDLNRAERLGILDLGAIDRRLALAGKHPRALNAPLRTRPPPRACVHPIRPGAPVPQTRARRGPAGALGERLRRRLSARYVLRARALRGRARRLRVPPGPRRPARAAAQRAAQRPIDCWYRVKPMPEQTAAMIQKRSMILVSDQAIISK